MPERDDLVPLGRVSGTHGIKGEVKISWFAGECGSLSSLRTLIFRSPAGESTEVVIRTVRAGGARTILRLEGYDSIEAVERFKGWEVAVRRSQLPDAAEGEYYWHDLIGLSVLCEDGSKLGTLSGIFETGSHDVYMVKGDGREYLLPATDDVIRDIDLDAGTMTVSPLGGLLDL